MAQQPANEYLRHGQTPFFRLPTLQFHEGGGPRERVDAVLLGVPYDGGTTYQPGARLAPYHVRRVSALLQTFHPWHQVDVFGTLNAFDGGNITFPPFDASTVRAAIEHQVTRVLELEAVPFLIGGDHSISLPALRAVARAHGQLAVVHVDAHLDTSDAHVWGDAHHHGTPLRHVLTEGLVAQGALHQVGVRATWGHAEEGALTAQHGAVLHGMDELAECGMAASAASIRAAIGDRPTYITFDVDGIDPAFAPGTGTPVPGGLTSREALRLLRGLRGIHLVGMDVVEVAPALDIGDNTSTLAAHLLYEGLALLALSPRTHAD